ncbi:VanZ family protein [Gracilibacillus caseinilyticus]|uniref:VanZ family protein n=1 Tax=Gracilibacillus caseinilyticus TaxID=2932256 RepID=A0ABY4EWH7_9BACI|nr:VanZ family protein [Gracilibacillus caseinilyticus]UOQ48320.1 VanZ family protein [Gracilibacillus caseinilyticus]
MKKIIYWMFPFVLMWVIYLVSDQPYPQQDIKPFLSTYVDLSFLESVLSPVVFDFHHSEVSVAALGVEGVVEFIVRKGAHFFVFLTLACSFYIAMRKSFPLRSQKLVAVLSFLLTVLYAISDEWHQVFTAGRTPYAGDVMIDSLGALIGILAILIGNKLRK